jgi:hypothetical protein
MQARKISSATILFALWSVAATCVADSWRLPETETVYSRNRQFAVSIIPKQLAIVIYRTDGSLVRSLSLEDVLTAKDIEVLPKSVSSIQWGAQHYIDEDRHLLVLRIARCTGLDLCLEEPPEVAIHLADGTLFRPARDLLPQLEPTVSARPGTTPNGQDWQADPGDPLCASQASFSRAPEVPFDSLHVATTDLALPSFTELARKARVQGSVILELLVDKDTITCVRTIKGLPLGLTGSARDAALQWRFLPSPDRTGPVRSVVAFDFNLVEVKPEPEM